MNSRAGRRYPWLAQVLATFPFIRYRPNMTDAPRLRPAAPDEIADALSFALLYQGRKRVHDADQALARITADRLVQHLEQSGFVVMKAPSSQAPTAASHLPKRPAS